MQQLYIYESMVTGYARKTMNNTYITHHPQRATIEWRIKVLNFFDRYGAVATDEAFSVSRSTIFLWKQKLNREHGQLIALAPGDRAPKTRRRRTTDPRITSFIVNQRSLHPRLGKDKLAVLLHSQCRVWGIPSPSTSTVGRVLLDLKDQGSVPLNVHLSMSAKSGRLLERTNRPLLKKRRRGDYRPKVPGDLVQIDTVVKFIRGIRRYCVTAVDVHGRFSFAYAYKSPSSANATDFLTKLQTVAPFEVRRVQTDNGSEFYKHFHQACEDRKLVHFWNYPRSPKMNARVERFNRTIQEEFIDTELDLMADNIDQFNRTLMDWLIWYNTVRPHFALGQVSPMQYLISNFGLSNMLWTHTAD
jgi:putative transposase